MKPIKEKDLELLNEIQEINNEVSEGEEKINAKIEKMVKEKNDGRN